ncbi:MAG: hypothetical protein K2X66_11875, partial [Cyanobacteria bacterium]|nr:hypothetical protein [Cyanobacteriota bacterium]
ETLKQYFGGHRIPKNLFKIEFFHSIANTSSLITSRGRPDEPVKFRKPRKGFEREMEKRLKSV